MSKVVQGGTKYNPQEARAEFNAKYRPPRPANIFDVADEDGREPRDTRIRENGSRSFGLPGQKPHLYTLPRVCLSGFVSRTMAQEGEELEFRHAERISATEFFDLTPRSCKRGESTTVTLRAYPVALKESVEKIVTRTKTRWHWSGGLPLAAVASGALVYGLDWLRERQEWVELLAAKKRYDNRPPHTPKAVQSVLRKLVNGTDIEMPSGAIEPSRWSFQVPNAVHSLLNRTAGVLGKGVQGELATICMVATVCNQVDTHDCEIASMRSAIETFLETLSCDAEAIELVYARFEERFGL